MRTESRPVRGPGESTGCGTALLWIFPGMTDQTRRTPVDMTVPLLDIVSGHVKNDPIRKGVSSMLNKTVSLFPSAGSGGDMVKGEVWHKIHSRNKLKESKKFIIRTISGLMSGRSERFFGKRSPSPIRAKSVGTRPWHLMPTSSEAAWPRSATALGRSLMSSGARDTSAALTQSSGSSASCESKPSLRLRSGPKLLPAGKPRSTGIRSGQRSTGKAPRSISSSSPWATAGGCTGSPLGTKSSPPSSAVMSKTSIFSGTCSMRASTTTSRA